MKYDYHTPASRNAFRAYAGEGSIGISVDDFHVRLGENDTRWPIQMNFEEWRELRNKIDAIVAEKEK